MTQVHGLECYVTPPLSSTVESKSAIIYFTDGFGLGLINNKALCDEYAKGTGMRVYAPNVIIGNPPPIRSMDAVEAVSETPAWTDIWGHIRKIKGFIDMAITMGPFLMRSPPPKAYDTVLDFTRKIKAELPAEGKLGVCGACWGGYHSTRLCTETVEEGSSQRLVDASYQVHPSALSAPDMIVDAIKKYKTPYSLALGDKDIVLSPKKVDETKSILETEAKDGQTGYQYEFIIYKGMAHGFGVRGDAEDPAIREEMNKAKDQAVNWFKKYL